MKNRWLLEPDAEDAVAPKGGAPPGPFALKGDPPHPPTKCVVVYGPDDNVARGRARLRAWKRRKERK